MVESKVLSDLVLSGLGLSASSSSDGHHSSTHTTPLETRPRPVLRRSLQIRTSASVSSPGPLPLDERTACRMTTAALSSVPTLDSPGLSPPASDPSSSPSSRRVSTPEASAGGRGGVEAAAKEGSHTTTSSSWQRQDVSQVLDHEDQESFWSDSHRVSLTVSSRARDQSVSGGLSASSPPPRPVSHSLPVLWADDDRLPHSLAAHQGSSIEPVPRPVAVASDLRVSHPSTLR